MAARIFRIFNTRQILRLIEPCNCRLLATQASEKYAGDSKCSPLRKRGLLKVKGRDATKFLQGLVTNDVQAFHEDSDRKALYAFFLNTNGRAMYDVFLYKYRNSVESPSFFLECDLQAITDLTNHLKMFKLRSKVDICQAADYESWVIFSPSGAVDLQCPSADSDILLLEKDPRTERLGFRAVLPKDSSPSAYIEDVYETGDTFEYDVHRAKHGICEGVDEIPPGSAMPLEYNLAYLNGVSFHKGCYLGQELIARTHHTGVVRKRTVPVKLMDPKTDSSHFETGAKVKTGDGKVAGKLCMIYGQYGVGLMRLEMLKKGENFFVTTKEEKEVELVASLPQWWPCQNSKM
ncbi:putative transferase CAF17 homolog, mitochondrial [Montipora foliosa]|uniref:putative transferase CAF17 homolog, mitochondrial n=1 Tax=Montipora foliosa TaxID=591990 RepID=UPI0035F15CD6